MRERSPDSGVDLPRAGSFMQGLGGTSLFDLELNELDLLTSNVP